MKNTETLLGEKARKAVLAGVNAIYEPVKRTLGPQGKTALLYRTYNRGSRITDDGVTVAEVQEPKDPFIKLSADTFKEMCKRTVEKVGDGTTTTAVIGGKLMNDGYKLLSGGSDFTAKGSSVGSMDLRRKILASADLVKAEILKRATKITTLEDLERVATISVKDEKLGKLIAGMAWEVGVDGYIDVVEGYKGEIETEVIKGMRFMAKVPAKAFVNNQKRYEMVAQDCPVLLTNIAFSNSGEIAPLLSKFNTEGVAKIIIIAPSFADNVLIQMVAATKQGYFMYPVAVPGLRTEQLEDLAVYTGATFFDKNKGRKLQNATQNDLGFLEKLVVKDSDSRDEAVATGGAGTRPTLTNKAMGDDTLITTPIQDRIEMLKGQVEEQKQNNFKLLIQRRIASMASAVGVIRVGDSTDASALYLKLKIEDGVYASKAALRGGYVKGGGLCLKEISEILDPTDLLVHTLCHPYELIQNSMPNGVEITDDVIDPAEAMYYAVEHATSVVAQLLTVDVLTPEVDDVSDGDALMALANMVKEFVISNKIHLGQLLASEAEQERDRLGGLTTDEKVMLDNG